MILAAGMAAGCTETTKVGPDSYEAPLFLQPSDSKIVFDKEGGKALVTMATNATSWNYTAQSGDWFHSQHPGMPSLHPAEQWERFSTKRVQWKYAAADRRGAAAAAAVPPGTAGAG